MNRNHPVASTQRYLQLSLIILVSVGFLFPNLSFTQTKELIPINKERLYEESIQQTVAIGEWNPSEELPLDESDYSVTLGTGTTNVSHPIFDFWHNVGSISLYTAAEIQAAGGTTGLITHLRWNASVVQNWPNGRQVWISIKPISESEIPIGTWSQVTAGSTEVFNSGGQNYRGPSATGWNTWDISDYYWDGTSNLLICVRSYRPAYSPTSTPWRGTTGLTNKHWFRQFDAGDMLTNTTVGTRSGTRPNLQLEIQSIPSAPYNPTPSPQSIQIPTNVVLGWTAGALSTSFDVLLNNSNPPTTVRSDDQIGTTWTPTPLLIRNNTTYYWQIIANNIYGSTPGPIWSFTTGTFTTPNVPSNAVITNTTNSSLSISFQDNSTNESAFPVYVSTNGSDFNLLTEINHQAGTGTVSFTVGTLNPNVHYYFRIHSANENGASVGYAAVDGWTRCMPAGTIQLGSIRYTNLRVTSIPNDGNPANTQYRVKVNPTTYVLFNGVPITQLAPGWSNYLVSGLTSGDIYQFRAVAVNGAGIEAEGPPVMVIMQNYHKGGPDAYGYYFRSNFASADFHTPTFNWVQLTNPTTLPLSGDDEFASLSLGTFSFPFYGNTYSTIYPTTNGAIGFTTGDRFYNLLGDTLPFNSTRWPPVKGMFPYIEDHEWGTTRYLRYQNMGDGRFVMQVLNSPAFSSTTTDLISYQVILYQNGDFVFQYNQVLNPSNAWSNAVIGIQDSNIPGAGRFLQVGPVGMIPANGTAIKFYRVDYQNGVGVSCPGGQNAFSAVFPTDPSTNYSPPVGMSFGNTTGNNPTYLQVRHRTYSNAISAWGLNANELNLALPVENTINRIWDLQQTGGNNYTATVALRFTANELPPSITDPPNQIHFAAVKHGIQAWYPVPCVVTGPDVNLVYTATVTGVTSFSYWGLGIGGILPVNMTSLDATSQTNGVSLIWRVESEISNDFFRIYRSNHNDDLGSVIGQVDGRGTAMDAKIYQFIDRSVQENVSYYYRIADVSEDGIETMHPFLSQITYQKPTDPVVLDYKLYPVYPNPFNAITHIQYELPKTEYVVLTIQDVQGRTIATLVDNQQSANTYNIVWNAQERSSGLYFAHLRVGKFTAQQKMLFIK